MKPIEMKLKSNWEYHTGHCQITYVTSERLTYCLQDNGAKFGGVRLMRCTDDGEPSHEVSFTKPLKFEKPSGDSRLEKLVIEWIENYENLTKTLTK